ncbi:MAG: hypothetical protein KDA71_10010, partial [Planctomycetales bacterium]|nr:hypothetical protein [Planctomycetales bacterium]
MSWTNVRLIFQREFRDQLRDRRTLFTIVVLPLLLYPLLGMTFLQVAQFMQEHPTKILLVGSNSLPDDPPLLIDDGDMGGPRFARELVSDEEMRLIQLELIATPPVERANDAMREWAQEMIQSGEYDLIVDF